MHLRNKTVIGFLLFSLPALVPVTWGQAQAGTQPPGQSSAQNQKVQPTPLPSDIDPSDPALPVWARPATPAPAANASPSPAPGAATTASNVPSNVPPGQQPGQPQPQVQGQNQPGQVQQNNGKFTFRVQTEEVTLPVTVLDQKHHLVTDLSPRDFSVYEDGAPQTILHFSREDIPVSIGILVDNSGSMRTKRNAVTKAVVNLVKASNPQDEVFVVNFNDEPYLDQDFTNNIGLMQEALDRVDSRGGTALYDAVIASADHLAKAAKREKKVLLVVTDGEDNESREPLEQAIRAVQNDAGPTIYTIGILGEEGGRAAKRARRALEGLSIQTGGVAFFPRNLDEVDEISREVARDIRNQYTIIYRPTNPRANGGYRTVKVVAHAPGYKDLQVRTRSGYFASEQRTASTTGGTNR